MTRPLSLGALLVVLALPTQRAQATASRSLTLDERLAAQRAIEQVYWRHRIWPAENGTRKPSFESMMPASAIRAKVEDYLKKSTALERLWHRPMSGDQLQAELDRMARGSRDSRMLQELFDALGDDPFLIAETLARPAVAERLVRNWFATDDRFQGEAAPPTFDAWWKAQNAPLSTAIETDTHDFRLPKLDPMGSADDTWTPTFAGVPDGRFWHTAVWTGTEMIVWGGKSSVGQLMNTGGRYNPATDTWTQTSTDAAVPTPRRNHTAVWTGTAMIVWGGFEYYAPTRTNRFTNSGGLYDPVADRWTATSMGSNVPQARINHTAIWTGTAMIVWGGSGASNLNTGGRYDPTSDGWTPTSTGVNTPSARSGHTAVWTGMEMIVWGGGSGGSNTGGRYHPTTDSWTPTSTGANVPSARSGHTAVWTGTEMIVWGGTSSVGELINTGGRYNPSSNSWASAPMMGGQVPTARESHSAVWTGSKMIVWGGTGAGTTGATYEPTTDSWTATASTALTPRVFYSAVWTGTELIVWGGYDGSIALNSGGRYNATTNGWVATSTSPNVPSARQGHSAVWTGTEMIVWGGTTGSTEPVVRDLDTGGRYTPATDSWVPTSLSADASPRESFSAVWTGREMIVWGGAYIVYPSQSVLLLNTGARYDPLTDTWSATSTGANVPAARGIHLAIWTGKEMAIWGGCCSAPSGGRYDPVTNSWREMASGADVPGGTNFSTSVWTGSEIITWGNHAGARYDPIVDSWSAIPTGPDTPSGYYSSAVWTGTDMIVWGGGPPFVNSGARFNPATNAWTPTSTGPGVPDARTSHVAVWTGSEMIVWGGTNNALTPYVPNSGGRYDPATDSWRPTSLGDYVPGHYNSRTAVWTGTEMIVWGGDPGTSTGGRYCACPSGRLVYRDVDGDGYGDPGVSSPSCDGSAPAGYVVDFTDCNDANANAHPAAVEACNGSDDDCDGLVDESVSGEDSDGDSVHDACDNCPFAPSSTQSDFDHDGQGDACDLDDGVIYEWRDDKTSVSWQAEAGPTSWNVYVGHLDVLRTTGAYTQLPGSNALADRHCGEIATVVSETVVPPAGKASYSLVTGVASGAEGSLGSATSGERANANPCP